jgi:hypothetical protein
MHPAFDGDAMANSISDTSDALLTRSRTAEALTEAGFPVNLGKSAGDRAQWLKEHAGVARGL